MMKKPFMWSSSSAGICSSAICSSFILLEVFAAILPVSGASRFVVEPQSIFSSPDSTVVLTCAVDPSIGDIRWLFNGSLIKARPPHIVATGSRLVLNSSSHWQEGLYQCVANNSFGATLSAAAYVGKAYLGDFVEDLLDRNIEISESNTAVIPCATPRGAPPTVTEFEKNSTKLTITARHRILPSGNLQIARVEEADGGVYRCIALNPVTGERRSAPNVVMLTVTEPANFSQPQFTWTPLSHVEVIRGQNLTLECVAEGHPVPRVTWKRYGGTLPESRTSTVWGNLKIEDVQKQDEGTYICAAEVNGTQPHDYVAFIDVLEPPTITSPLSDMNVTESDTVTLNCQAVGTLKISITWFHNAVPVVATQQVIISNGSLTFKSIELQHSGIYQCLAENSAGMDYALARLIVGAKDESIDVNTGNQNEMQNVAPSGAKNLTGTSSTGSNKSKKLPKSPSSQPRPTSPPAAAGAAADAAALTDNPANGDPNGQATLLPPSKPTVSKTSDTSVLLSWTVTQNGSLPVVFFKVQYKEIVDNKRSRWKTLDEEISPSSRSYEVLDLKMGATYQFRIAAVYSNHDNKNGPVSDRFALKADSLLSVRSRAPVTSPMIVDLRENITSFIVIWQYQPVERVSIDGFNVFYKPYDSDVSYTSIRVAGSTNRKTTITGLNPDTLYSIRMTCFNADGESDSSISVVRKTLGLFESSRMPSYGKDFVEPTDVRWPATTTTTASRPLYTTMRINTHASNELLFIILGVVLGIMMFVLCVVMVTCAFKQRQQQRLMEALEGRRKFHDPSKTIYVGSQMKSAPEGGFLLNGVSSGARKTTTNGYLASRADGIKPTSEYELRSTKNSSRALEEVPLKGQRSPEHEEEETRTTGHGILCNDLKQTGCNPNLANHECQFQQPAENGITVYHPPDDLPSISRPKDVSLQQLSLKSSRSSCDYRFHGNDCSESYPSSQANTSPDHIPRLHECQLLYRSPEHTRRSRDRSRGRHDQVSDRSLSASSQVSSSHLRPARHLNQASDTGNGAGQPKITNILAVETTSSDADSRKGEVSENTLSSREGNCLPCQLYMNNSSGIRGADDFTSKTSSDLAAVARCGVMLGN